MLFSSASRISRKTLLLFLLDSCAVFIAIWAAIFLRLGWAEGVEYIEKHALAAVTVWVALLIAFYICGLYETDRLLSLTRTTASALLAVLLAGLVVTGLFYVFAFQEIVIGRGIFFGALAFTLGSVLLNRTLFIVATSHGFMAQRCLVIGTAAEARKVIELVQGHPHAGIKVLGIILVGADREQVGRFVGDYPVLGTLDSLEKFVNLYGIDRLILATTADFEPVLLRRLRQFRYRGIALVDFVGLYEELAYEIPIDHINDEWLFLASMNSSRFHIRRLKRVVDVVVALLGLVITAPIMAVTAVLIKLTSPGPVLYRQERLGRDSQPFMLIKFRTMREDAENHTGPVWATDDDPRITWLGKWLRKFRIDELPQLWNVLKGEMSLVGPRPERPVFVKKLSEKIPFYSERLLVAPGVTGWAQVMYPYAASIEESRRKLQYDLYYIKNMSFILDLLIVLKTIRTILFGRERTPQKSAPAPAPALEEIKTQTLFFPTATEKSVERPASNKKATGSG
ncbi:MAG: sugar transferase [Verrucomicrobiae bacterium]|nr:sugar transferase [Verrucomicrobiae bacterium]MDW8344932.1 sugar transferase [Verrucomicrobiae bacterium]